jgi:hypothetical protein
MIDWFHTSIGETEQKRTFPLRNFRHGKRIVQVFDQISSAAQNSGCGQEAANYGGLPELHQHAFGAPAPGASERPRVVILVSGLDVPEYHRGVAVRASGTLERRQG